MNREQIATRLAQLANLRKAAADQVDSILQTSLSENRARTADENESINTARAEVEQIDAEVTQLRQIERQLAEAEDAAADSAPTGVDTSEERAEAAAESRKRTTLKVGREPRTYERHDVRTSYLRDLMAARFQRGVIDPIEARDRLERHSAEARVFMPDIEARLAALKGGYVNEIRADGEPEPVKVNYEQRALSRTDGAGGEFVPPLWMMEEWISLSRASRVTADLCNQMPLPGGTDSINIPRIATGTATGVQTADGGAVTSTDATTDSVVAPVRTIAGQQDIAMQVLDQSPVAFDQIIFADLAEDHAVQTDTQVLNGSAASGQVRGIFNIASVDTTAYTDASPTVAELYPKLADSANEVATNRYRPVQAIIMHPRRWYWMTAAVDSSSRPLVALQAQGPQNALAAATLANPEAEGGPVGVTPFGPVFIDANIPTNFGTNEDRIILGRPSEYYLWEGPVRTRVMEEVLSGNLQIRLQLFNYVAFMPDRRPEATSIVAGTGLIAPVF